VKELPDKTKAIVHLINDNLLRTIKYNVDLENKTCSCHHYQESGVPCYHAIAFIRYLKISISKRHFYDFCFDYNLKDMFKDMNIYTTIYPSEDSIQKLISELDEDEYLIPLLAEVDEADISLKIGKRFPSAGENPNKSGVFKITNKGKKTCLLCGKITSIKTVHPQSACDSWYFDKQGKYPETTPIEGQENKPVDIVKRKRKRPKDKISNKQDELAVIQEVTVCNKMIGNKYTLKSLLL